MNKNFNEGYGSAKFYELVHHLFIDKEPARKKLVNNCQYFALIKSSDFKQEKHQESWKELQKTMKDKIKNYGSEKYPNEKLTIRNKTIDLVLETIWNIFDDCYIND